MLSLTDNSSADLGAVKTCFETLESGCEVVVYGVTLNVMAVLSADKQRVVVASNLPVRHILRAYKLRFRIECMFRFLKSKGFRWEATLPVRCMVRVKRIRT